MNERSFVVDKLLSGWCLFSADLEVTGEHPGRLTDLRVRVARAARDRFESKSLADDPVIASLRRLFRTAGCDPTRYRPSSEAVLRRLVKGDELPAIHPLVDINNCLSAELAVPCCVMADGTFEAPFVWRAGRAGESYRSLRGPFNLEGKPLLCDSRGPLDSPITGNERVKILPDTRRALLVAYLPADALTSGAANETLVRLVGAAPVVGIRRWAAA